MGDLVSTVKGLYSKYKGSVHFNRALIVAELSGFSAGAVGAQLTEILINNSYVISAGSLAVGGVGYLAGYSVTSFLTKKKEYTSDKKSFGRHMQKFSSGFIPGTIAYTGIKYFLTNLLVRKGFEPYQASLLGQIPATLVYLGWMNFFGHKNGLVDRVKLLPENEIIAK